MSKKNAKGGVFVDRKEFREAFSFLDSGRKGYVTLQDLRSNLGIFDDKLTSGDLRFLMDNKKQLTEAELYAMLADNELKDFDPVSEAFKTCEDPLEKGYADMKKIERILQKVGFSEITETDLKNLQKAIDMDKDGKVGLDDFRRMIRRAVPPE